MLIQPIFIHKKGLSYTFAITNSQSLLALAKKHPKKELNDARLDNNSQIVLLREQCRRLCSFVSVECGLTPLITGRGLWLKQNISPPRVELLQDAAEMNRSATRPTGEPASIRQLSVRIRGGMKSRKGGFHG